MKRSLLNLSLLFISVTFIFATCSKKDEPGIQPPIELDHSKGFLVTIGVLNNGTVDSVCLRYGPAEPVTEYGATSVTGGFIETPKHTWEIINAGANQWYFKYNDGRYLGYELNPYSIYDYDKYHVQVDNTPGERNLFVMNKEGNKFFIQPVSNKNVYLNTVPPRIQPPSPRHANVQFKDTKQLWFIMP